MKAFILTLLPLLASAADWNYANPNKDWCKLEKVCCADSTRQSPIDIDTKNAKEAKIAPLGFGFGYFVEAKGDLSNNGHSLQFTPTDGVDRVLSGGPLGKDTYSLLQFHFHWGKDSETGSEHTLDGKMYAGELHLVHGNNKYKDAAEMLGKPDGLAVVGLFIEEDKKSPSALKKFFKLAAKLAKKPSAKGSKILLGAFLNLIKDPTMMTTYLGSLTTPTCNEAVTWINILDPIKVGKKDLDVMRSFKDAKGEPIEFNYRPVQDLKDRKITKSKK